MNLKFNATKIDEIEQSRKLSLEQCIGDNTINNLALFIQKGLVDDNGNHGVSRAVAISKIDEYLKERDKDELLLDITEALVRDGFLSRTLNVDKMRQVREKRLAEAKEIMEEM